MSVTSIRRHSTELPCDADLNLEPVVTQRTGATFYVHVNSDTEVTAERAAAGPIVLGLKDVEGCLDVAVFLRNDDDVIRLIHALQALYAPVGS